MLFVILFSPSSASISDLYSISTIGVCISLILHNSSHLRAGIVRLAGMDMITFHCILLYSLFVRCLKNIPLIDIPNKENITKK